MGIMVGVISRLKTNLKWGEKKEEGEKKVSPEERLRELEEKYRPYGGLRALWLYVEEGKLELPVDPVEALDDLIEWKELLRERGVDPFKIIYPEEHAASSD
ncbi:MAG: hypothetical protein DRJ96_00585 [Thermoprotei archaeon]|nr:MAG: hypothetical protein DRJ96_00585 [Thermoprotei archaeon]